MTCAAASGTTLSTDSMPGFGNELGHHPPIFGQVWPTLANFAPGPSTLADFLVTARGECSMHAKGSNLSQRVQHDQTLSKRVINWSERG